MRYVHPIVDYIFKPGCILRKRISFEPGNIVPYSDLVLVLLFEVIQDIQRKVYLKFKDITLLSNYTRSHTDFIGKNDTVQFPWK